MTLISRTPAKASCMVRGIGVAVSVRTWTFAFSCFSRSFWPTPKCCSSSTTSSPRRRKATLLARSAWVPTTMSTRPSARSRLIVAACFGADQARQLLDAQRQPGEALLEGAEMLAREQRRRHHDRDLRPGHGRDERRAQRHLGLAEADIAANQAIHRPSRGHIAQRLENGAVLVVGFGIGKARGEFLVEALGRRHGLALAQLALRRDRDQLVGDVLDPLLDPRLARLPRQRAQPVERHLGILGAVARQHLDVLDRHEQLVVAGINDAQAIMRRARHFERDEPVIAADAVLGMDDEIARRERRRLRRRTGRNWRAGAAAAPAGRRECPAR